MLSPWEHHNERRPLTAAQCTQMNLMALEIGGRNTFSFIKIPFSSFLGNFLVKKFGIVVYFF